MKQLQITTLILSLIFPFILFAQEQKKASEKSADTLIEAAYMKINKKSIGKAKPMIEFFLKYDKKDNAKTPKQADFDLLIKQMGLSEEVKNDGSGLTKEDAFQLIDAYIKADKNKSKTKIKPDSDLINKEIKQAEAQFEELKPEIEKFMKEAQKEAEKIKYKDPGISYQDFRKKAKTKKPELNELEIKKAYEELMKAMGYN